VGLDTPETVNLYGGALCLDFANSVDWSAAGEPIEDEILTEPDRLVRWGRRLGIVAKRRPLAVDAAELAAALELRAAVHRAFAAIAAGNAPAPSVREQLTRHHADAAGAARLMRAADAWRLDWAPDDPRRVRFAVAVDAMALITDPERLPRVRHCPGHHCGWLFLDTSGRRRWCSMDTCGSRAKMRRLYARQRAARHR
jgi:predicted RNA-binding Zn ribbon-like protein